MLRKKRGVALIITVGMLSLMAILATSFAYNMMFDLKGSVNHVFKLKAKNAADAGIALAIAYMRNLAITDFNATPTASCDWGYTNASSPSFDARDGTVNNSTSGLFGNVGRNSIAVYSLKVVDTNAQINVNDTNPNLRDILGNLTEVLGLARADGEAIADNANRPFATKEEVMTSTGWTAAKYAVIRDYIAVNGYFDENSEDSTAPVPLGPGSYQRKSPVNINTASSEVLQAVLRGVITDQQAAALAAAIIAQRNTVPFRGWNAATAAGGFDDFIDNVSITPALGLSDRANVKDNANPNRIKPSTSTTDFCFNPGGFFEITSTGTTGVDANSDGDLSDIIDMVSAKQETVVIARIYEVLNYTTKEQFRGEDANYNGVLDPGEDKNGNGILELPVFSRVTWLNSCPVLSNEDQGLVYAANYSTIPNSLKLGYWDGFDEDNDNVSKNGYSWSNWQQQNGVLNISDSDADGECEMWGSGWPKFALADISKWTFGGTFSFRVSLRPSPGGDGWEDSGHIDFSWAGQVKGKLWTQNWGFQYSPRRDITRPGWTVANDSATSEPSSAREGKDFADSKVLLHMWKNSPALRNERTYNLGYLYGLSDPQINHYFDYTATSGDQGAEQFHGVCPVRETLKLVVSNAQSPNYRVYLAVGQGWHRYYNFSNGWFLSSVGFSPTTTGYVMIPFHADASNELKRDRYGFWTITNNDINSWQLTQWYPVLYGNNASPQWDELRIISPDGTYRCPTFMAGENVRWGTISWTVTVPSTANASSEQVSMQVDTGSGAAAVSKDGPIGGVSGGAAFIALLSSINANFTETPVLEDVTLTYLPPVEIVYCK
ncbi:MAG: type II secretion system protein GspK [Candidatus Omnitrophota bacterium]